MNLTDDTFILKCQSGSPIFIEDICAVFPPLLREVASVGYDNFLQYIQILTTEKPYIKEKNELSELIKKLTNFEYFLFLVSTDKNINQLAQAAFNFFTHEQVFFSTDPAQIIIGPLTERHIIDEEKFLLLQNIIRHMNFLETEEPIIIMAEDSEQVKALKQRMIENRAKLAKAKKNKAKQEHSDVQFSDLIGSLCVNNCGVNMTNVWDLTYYAFHDQIKRMGWRDQFDINNRAALAGAKINKKELKHWIKPIVDNK